MAVLLGHGKVPVRVQRDARGKRRQRHVDVRYGHDPKQDLAGYACPAEGEEVDVEEDNGQFGEAER